MNTEKKKINRRTFLKSTSMGSASLALSAGFAGSVLAADKAKDNSQKIMPSRILGKTGVPLSILGMGGSVDASGYQILLRIALNMGITYWDCANSYGNGKNEIVIGQFFNKYPEDRKRVFQVTKASRTTEPKAMTEQLDLSLERMQTDYIDLYFMHGIVDPGVLTPDIKQWAEQKKKAGKIKFFGFSCHSNMAQLLMHASTLGWIDAVMPSYSYQLMNNDDMKRGVDACARTDIGLIAMKTQGQRFRPPSDKPEGEEMPGGLSQGAEEAQYDLSAISHFMDKGYTPEQAKLKVVWEDKRIATCVSEMTNLTMLKSNVSAAVDGVQLSDRDRQMLNTLAQNSCGLYCRGCLRCESVMGKESRIPDVLRYMMYFHSYGKTDDARRLFGELPESVRHALAASDYTEAERNCPNKIRIGSAMREALRLLG